MSLHSHSFCRCTLADLAEGVSDTTALRLLLKYGAQVRGVRNLHAKLYLFGDKRAIITSANLTKSALSSNHEFGVVAEDAYIVKECRAYFDNLWQQAGSNLSHERIDGWEKTVNYHPMQGGRRDNWGDLGDLGADIGFTAPPPASMPTVVAGAPQAFVKLGNSQDRVLLSCTTIEEIKRSGCHWAVAYPARRRPRSVNDGAIIFISRTTRDPNDHRVFGRAIGMKYESGRDDATSADIKRRSWKERWPRYIRLHNAEFVAGTMENGVSLDELMKRLGADSFVSTQRNAASGQGNINPHFALRRQPQVQLTDKSFSWLNERLQAAFDEHGKVSQGALDRLDWPEEPAQASQPKELDKRVAFDTLAQDLPKGKAPTHGTVLSGHVPSERDAFRVTIKGKIRPQTVISSDPLMVRNLTDGREPKDVWIPLIDVKELVKEGNGMISFTILGHHLLKTRNIPLDRFPVVIIGEDPDKDAEAID